MEETRSRQWLLVSDLDGTLTGHDGGVSSLSELGVRVALVLNSSRPRASVLRTLALLPTGLKIDGLITAMGTEVMVDGVDRNDWTEKFRGWDRRPVDAFMESVGMLPHRPEHQGVYKASYHVPAERWQEFRRRVLDLVPASVVVTSGESDFDVLPAAAGKDKATAWVARLMGFDPSRVIVAGDSGNDVDMFNAARMAIAVSNSRHELIDRVNPAKTYFASQPSALGVIEGLRHWGALPDGKEEAR
ncbi:HAD-IIB family hydrolase [Luteolibacter luteus]|uniref:HAD-IIB family hydrolase n=1 Tax=Luteolibacter luteus TaxID=2728835 RepID=A0A858REE0_9BACT|nr:HAD-IIB family hydrolase [Luteolibacter luteus]QJE94533.1 HAD-IIB family hydrolase [Luteolibacter luteus]